MARERSEYESLESELEDSDHLATRPRLILHERICSMRHKTINARLGRIEKILITTSAAMLTGMGSVIFALLSKLPPH